MIFLVITVGAVTSATTTCCVTEVAFPLLSVTAQTTEVVPTGKVFPSGLRVIEAIPTLSLAEGGVNVTTAVHGVPFTFKGCGVVTVGGVISRTIMVCVKVAVLPLASVAVQTTEFVPIGNVPPAAFTGLLVIVTLLQLSVAIGGVKEATAVFGAPFKVRFGGVAVKVGGVTSRTVTFCVTVAVLPLASVAVHTTEVVPIQKLLPSGLRVIEVIPQLSEAEGGVNETVAQFGAPFTVIFWGVVVKAGGVASRTVTVCVVVAVLPLTSVTVHTTEVIPTGKVLVLGLRVMEEIPHASSTGGVVNDTFAIQVDVFTTTGCGEAILGAVLSTTVTVAEALEILPLASVTERVTMLDPISSQVKNVLLRLKDIGPQVAVEPLLICSGVIMTLPPVDN